MTNWRPNPDTLKRPVYMSLVKAIESDIRAGVLKFGEQMPTHRDLAYDLGVSVQTVSRAYDELASRNLIAGEIGRGSFVRANATEAQPPFIPNSSSSSVIDLSILKPVVSTRHEDEMRKALAELSEGLTRQMVSSFRPNNAHQEHRKNSIAWLTLCGVDVHPDSVLITDGATPALTVALISAARSGSTLLVEEITHHTILPLARYLGVNITPVKMDKNGAKPAAIDAACRKNEVCALYLGPNGENPWGYIMPLDRRREIANIARKHDIYIIENGVFGPLPNTKIPPIAALAPERTFYATSFTKCVMPGLRTGYLVAPERIMPSVLNRHLIMNWMANPLSAEIASRWVESGLANDLVEWQRVSLKERHKLVSTCLPKGSYQGFSGGLHVWVDVPKDWGEQEFVSHAHHRGVATAPSKPFIASDDYESSSIRISVGSSSYDELKQGLKIISNLLASAPEPSLLLM